MHQIKYVKGAVIILAFIFIIVLSINPPRAENCFAVLSKAEKRWNELRYETPINPAFNREVTQLLTRAAELRHRGRAEACLRQVEKAKEKMNTREGKP